MAKIKPSATNLAEHLRFYTASVVKGRLGSDYRPTLVGTDLLGRRVSS